MVHSAKVLCCLVESENGNTLLRLCNTKTNHRSPGPSKLRVAGKTLVANTHSGGTTVSQRHRVTAACAPLGDKDLSSGHHLIRRKAAMSVDAHQIRAKQVGVGVEYTRIYKQDTRGVEGHRQPLHTPGSG